MLALLDFKALPAVARLWVLRVTRLRATLPRSFGPPIGRPCSVGRAAGWRRFFPGVASSRWLSACFRLLPFIRSS